MDGSCKDCRWYDDWFGVCCNGDSPYCADTPPCPDRCVCTAHEERKT